MSHEDHTVRARRCSTCGINYPPFVAVCRACGEDTWALTRNSPDENWTELVAMHRLRIEADEPVSVYPHRADNEATIYRDSGDRLWVTHADLLKNGYRAVTEDSILYLNEKFYECQTYSNRAGSWLIEEVLVDDAAESLEPHHFNASSEA